ncbi:MAG: hypothetical protein JSS97_05720 [Actinobacteria bacterium]|nr:hypothetical protein [Actinomycetota bacterium]
MDGKRQLSGNRTPDGKADIAAARREFEESTPGRRVEQAISLSAELSRLAIRGRERAKTERA